MNLLSAENLAKSFGERLLFREISFGLQKGDKVALVGANGTGKTSIFRILAGKDLPDEGKVGIRKGIRLGFLEQEPVIESESSVSEYLRSSGSKILDVIREYQEVLEMQNILHSSEAKRRLEMVTAKMELYHAWDYERRITQILHQFNITNLDQKVDTLSGGQKKRLALALVLLDNPELLLLDEPTNHLDINMIEWLEEYLQLTGITLLMITHDRYFLDRVCNRIMELSQGSLFSYSGNYCDFLEKKTIRESAENISIEKAEKLMKSELEWIRRMPKARTSKSKSRIDAFYEVKEKANSGRKTSQLKLNVKMNRMGGKILELMNLTKSYQEIKIVDHFNYSFLKGEKIGIIGKNGVGKSAFLNLISGIEQPDSGRIDSGVTIVFGYYKQDGIIPEEDKRVIDVVKDIAEIITLKDGKSISASQFLQHFLFTPEMQYSYVSKLSGGERRCLYLLTVLIKNPNFLILDEPTNDLDIISLNKIEEFLQSFGGCLVIATHDRYFLDKLVDHIFVFEGNGKIVDFTGTYSEYHISKESEEKREESDKAVKKPQNDAQEKESIQKKRKLSFKEKQEYEKLEKEIAELEIEKTGLEKVLNSGGTDFQNLQKTSSRIAEVISLLDSKILRWLELDEKLT